jgi:hypothetical protein
MHDELNDDGSEFFEEEDDDLYDFMNLRSKPSKSLSEFNDEDELNIFEAASPPRIEVVYEDCRGNRSTCCGADHEDKDHALDSTMSFSIKDDAISRRNNNFRALSQRNKAALSHFDGEQDIDIEDKDFEMLMMEDEGKFL